MSANVQALAVDQEMSRREFLNYAWLASLGIFTLQLGVVSFQFALPRLAPGEFGGTVPIGSVDALPAIGADPSPFNKAKFWWVQTKEGALAIYKVCTHLGCIYGWKPEEGKFICPCHGSQFEREGKFIQGPAPRNLDSFVIKAFDAGGKLLTETDEKLVGKPVGPVPVKIPAGANVVVETGLRIIGKPKG
jgi:cytochrome b6-f complex iron-sulfur subunit